MLWGMVIASALAIAQGTEGVRRVSNKMSVKK